MTPMTVIDLAIVALYFLFTAVVGMGLFHSRRSDAEDYLVAGRSVSLPAFVATLVATWYGGILGVGEYSYTYGLANWVVFGLPYYVFALIFALFLAHRVREAALYTIPDRIAVTYGKAPAVVASAFAFIMVSPAPYVLGLGVLIGIITGWNLWISVVAGTLLSTFYVANGGLRTDIRVNVFQFALMFAGFGLIYIQCVGTFGGLGFLRENLPPLSITWHGGNSPQTIAVWFLIAAWTLVDPGFHQRCYAAKSPRVARNGILTAIVFWFVFDFLTCFTGLYARAAAPNLSDPMMSYPALAAMILPPVAMGFFYVGMLATVMSTVLSYTFLGAVTLGRDVVWRLKGDPDESRVPAYTRWGLILAAGLAILLALAIPSVVRLWLTIGSLCVPGLLAPVLGSYFLKRPATSAGCLASMAGGFGTSLVWLVSGQMRTQDGFPAYWLGIEPMLPGLAASFIILALAPRRERS